MEEYYNQFIKDKLKEKDIYIAGFADLSMIDKGKRKGFKYGIVIAKTVNKDILKYLDSEKTLDYYNEVNNLNDILKDASKFLEKQIISKGYKAFSMAGVKQNEFFRTELPFKTIATNSGLGWIGKSGTLITSKYGNAIRFNGVLTDMPLKCGKPVTESRCGNCTSCVDNCPAHAIKGKLWNVNMDRDEILDAPECKKSVIERGRKFNILWGSCDKCLTSCPYTRKYMNS